MRIAIPMAGAMGGGIGRILVQHGAEVLTCLDDRSEATRTRAAEAGMREASFAEMARADIILSIVPPGIAEDVAARFADLIGPEGRPLFVEMNAVSPETVRRIEALFHGTGARFSDGAIIGAAPRPGDDCPRLYVSGPGAEEAMEMAALGLRMERCTGGVGGASALKMCYGALNKGTIALTAAIFLAAERNDVGDMLCQEMAFSQPDRLKASGGQLPDMYSKAYRWVAEMEEIAGFLGSDSAEAGIWRNIADLYRRLAEDNAGPRDEIAAMEAFITRSRKG